MMSPERFRPGGLHPKSIILTGTMHRHRISKKTPFDKGEAHKAFTRLLESVSAGDASLPFELPKQGKALIPGCGRVSDSYHTTYPKGQACIGLMADSLSRIISYRSDPSQLFHHPHHDRRTTVLTPGCLNTQRRIPVEQGYDVEALSRLGLDSTGIEVSSKAVEAANIWLETQGSPKNESDGMTQRNQAKKEVELGDFFTWDQAGSRGGYDVFYDYT